MPPGLAQVTVGVALFTSCATFPLLAAKLVLPPKQAVTPRGPAVRVLLAKVALPVPSSGVAAWSVAAGLAQVPPSMKVADPVGVPPAELTVAVTTTDWPKVDGLRDEVTTVVVAACVIVRLPVPAAVAKFGSAGKVAVTLREPAPSPKVAGFTPISLALPDPLVASVPTGVPSILKLIVLPLRIGLNSASSSTVPP